MAALASPDVTTELQAMNDADCVASKTGNWAAFEKTLAPEYVSVNVDGSRDDRASLVAYLSKPSGDRVTGCSTAVSKVERDGDIYYLYGRYVEDGTRGPRQIAYHNVQRIRDAWKRVDGSWLQTESITYEMTIDQGGKTGHFVLPEPQARVAVPNVTYVTHGDCQKYPSNVRAVNLAAQQYPEPARSLRLGGFVVDVEIAILPDGVQCGPRIAKTSGNLPIDTTAIRLAGQAFYKSGAPGGLHPAGRYLYHVRFTPPPSG
jgi:TonB family protein